MECVTAQYSVKRPGVGDRQLNEIAFAIAVSCQPPAVLPKDRTCISVPDNLDKFSCGPSLQCSPKQSRRKLSRRKTESGTSLLDLSALDFSHASVDDDDEMDSLDTSTLVEAAPQAVRLNERDVSSKGIESLSRALTLVRIGDSRPLVELQLAYNYLRDEGIGSLMWAAMQGSLRSLNTLVLTANRLRSMRGFATALRAGALPELRTLILSSNQITASGVADLAGARVADGTGALVALNKLQLDHNRLSEEDVGGGAGDHQGAALMASARAIDLLVRTCTSLTVLDLGSNNLGDAELGTMATAVRDRTAFSTTGGHKARLDCMLNCYTLRGLQGLQEACGEHGYVFCPS